MALYHDSGLYLMKSLFPAACALDPFLKARDISIYIYVAMLASADIPSSISTTCMSTTVDPQVATNTFHRTVAHYASTAGVVVYWYDLCLTFGDEVGNIYAQYSSQFI